MPRLVGCIAVISTWLHTDKPEFRVPPTVFKPGFCSGSLCICIHNSCLQRERLVLLPCPSRRDVRPLIIQRSAIQLYAKPCARLRKKTSMPGDIKGIERTHGIAPHKKMALPVDLLKNTLHRLDDSPRGSALSQRKVRLRFRYPPVSDRNRCRSLGRREVRTIRSVCLRRLFHLGRRATYHAGYSQVSKSRKRASRACVDVVLPTVRDATRTDRFFG